MPCLKDVMSNDFSSCQISSEKESPCAAHAAQITWHGGMLNDVDDEESLKRRHFEEILRQGQLTPLYQPIISLEEGEIIGYEGLIRGPSDSPLHSPIKLFEAAAQFGLLGELESLSRAAVLTGFAERDLPGKLFLNTSPECLLRSHFMEGTAQTYLRELGLTPDRIIIELTESRPIHDYEQLREAALYYQGMGFQIAIDDLGEGFSGLRLWSELRPDFVKIDQHFIQDINNDPVKLQFVKSIQQIAENAASRIVAEGIETRAELAVVRALGISYGQGYFVGRPKSVPDRHLAEEVMEAFSTRTVSLYPQAGSLVKNNATARKLLVEVEAVAPTDGQEKVYWRFVDNINLKSLPVVDGDIPVGLIRRSDIIEHFSRPFSRELNSRNPCSMLMRSTPIAVDSSISIEELSQMVTLADESHLLDGFIITENGKYVGMGTGHALIREITQLQISAARYANPLTLLPGNVPINQHMDRLLANKRSFYVAYCDLDHFKPFNDVYGYRKGDDMIQLLGNLLIENCDIERDFVGHIGGDDFIILFQSHDWETRCIKLLNRFESESRLLFDEETLRDGGYLCEDRLGQAVWHSLTSLSIGLVIAEPGLYNSHHEIAAAASEAKKMAKKTPGNSLFIERRKPLKRVDMAERVCC